MEDPNSGISGEWEVTDNRALRPQGPSKITHYWRAPLYTSRHINTHSDSSCSKGHYSPCSLSLRHTCVKAILPFPFIHPSISFFSVVLFAHVSLEQGDRWYPADLRANLIQHRENGYLIQTHEKQEIRMVIKHTSGYKSCCVVKKWFLPVTFNHTLNMTGNEP